MVILDTPVHHGPHLWYCSHLFFDGRHSMDFLKLERAGVKRRRNDYLYTHPREESCELPELEPLVLGTCVQLRLYKPRMRLRVITEFSAMLGVKNDTEENHDCTDFPKRPCRNCGSTDRPQFDGTCNDGRCDYYE